MGFQFIHLQSYSRKPDTQGRGTAFIFAESRRDLSASVHVASPAPPIVVYGMAIEAVEALHDAAADAARTTPKDGKPRKLRQDHKTLHTVVASHPHAVADIRVDAEKRREAEDWERRTIAWLRTQYGHDLKSVVRHEDESHFHVHAYVVPTDDPEMRALRHHPGTTAKRTVMAGGPDEGEDAKALSKRADAAYKQALRDWQDRYHKDVGIPCGLTRLGPQRRRLTRAEWQREQVQAGALAETIARANAVKAKVESYVREKREEAETLVSSTESTVADLKAEADATTAEAAQCLMAATVAHNAAVAEQRKARGMMLRVREEATKVRQASARLQRLPSLLRTLLDGFRQSRVANRIRASVDAEMNRLREQASLAFDRAISSDAARRKAEVRSRTLDASLMETVAQRDAARRELAKYQKPEREPLLSRGPRLKPGAPKN